MYINSLGMNVTRHAEERMKERLGWNKKTQGRMLPKVLSAGDTDIAKYRNYVDKKAAWYFIRTDVKSRYYIYGKAAFVCADNTLITVFTLDHLDRHKPNSEIKKYKRIHNYEICAAD